MIPRFKCKYFQPNCLVVQTLVTSMTKCLDPVILVQFWHGKNVLPSVKKSQPATSGTLIPPPTLALSWPIIKLMHQIITFYQVGLTDTIHLGGFTLFLISSSIKKPSQTYNCLQWKEISLIIQLWHSNIIFCVYNYFKFLEPLNTWILN